MNILFIRVLSGHVQSSLIYNDLPIGYKLKGRTMSSLRKDSKQHRSITAPFWKNKRQVRQQNYCQFYMRKTTTSVWKWFLRCNFGLWWWIHWKSQVYDFFLLWMKLGAMKFFLFLKNLLWFNKSAVIDRLVSSVIICLEQSILCELCTIKFTRRPNMNIQMR